MEFWETGSVGDPCCALEYLVDLLLYIFYVLVGCDEFPSEYVNFLVGLQEGLLVVLFEIAQQIVFEVIGIVPEHLTATQFSLPIFFH
jgi:hypothetical protein